MRLRLAPFFACAIAQIAGGQAATPDTTALGQARALIRRSQFDSAATVLRRHLDGHGRDGQAWLALGNAEQASARLDSADSAYRRASTIPGAIAPAMQALLSLYAKQQRADAAFQQLESLRRSGVDLTAIAALPDVKALHDDPRFALLFADKIAFDPPFVEPVRIIHEWRGERAGDEFGWIARDIGDVDHDRVDDIVVSAPANPPYGLGGGKVYVYSGKTGKLLWKTEGPAGALLGTSVEAAGDVNGDGIPDVIAGAPGINTVFVYSGRDGRELHRFVGDSTDVDLGTGVAGIGDVDGDGKADIVAGAPSSRPHGESVGRVYLYSGATGKRLLVRDGERAGDSFGQMVAGANGRLLVSAPLGGDRRTGRVYIYDRLKPTPTFVENADSTGAALGAGFLSIIGDVDGDRVPDIYASDFTNSARGRSTGRVYIYSGANGQVLRTFTGETPGEAFGIGVAKTGDVDGDGRADLVVGSWQFAGAAWSGGKVTVLSGKDGRTLQTITGKVPGETFGFDAVGIGDVDGDGAIDYLLTSAWSMVNGHRSGRTYIVSGRR